MRSRNWPTVFVGLIGCVFLSPTIHWSNRLATHWPPQPVARRSSAGMNMPSRDRSGPNRVVSRN